MSSFKTSVLFLAACAGLLAPIAMSVAAESEWIAFDPPVDRFQASPMDLSKLNEAFAGEHGRIQAKGGQFVHETTGEPVRFWAVNGPPDGEELDQMKTTARLLAKRGVNMVRSHGKVFDRRGEVDSKAVEHALDVVEAMKGEGIYTHFSIYFPLWFTPSADLEWLPGYDGDTHPFAALQFNPAFQAKYREWWKALLTTPNPRTGRTLLDDPAVFGLEIQNEDSFFFWTFNPERIPEPQLVLLERQFGDWLKSQYNSLNDAVTAWDGLRLERDRIEEGRMGFRPLWNIFNEKRKRDFDTVRFLYETQTRFYQETITFLRELGFKGLIHASNWHTASPEIFGPIEKLSYAVGDFIDRHGYFSCGHQGDNAAWSVRDGHTFVHRSALRFDAERPGEPKSFVHSVMDPGYAGKPSMISETTFTRPNRYRSEAPLYYAAYGSLQDSDAIVHFAMDGSEWSVKPRFWMQQWTLMSPSMMGQFPAAALMYRKGWIAPGKELARINLNPRDLFQLKGTPLPQDAAFDELRARDIPEGQATASNGRIDPLIHMIGQTSVTFEDQPTRTELVDLSQWNRRDQRKVLSSTGELSLDYGTGLLMLDAAHVQGASGKLNARSILKTALMEIQSPMDLAHVVLIALDDRPLANSSSMLLQVMTEEQSTGFQTREEEGNRLRIVDIGRNPWQFKSVEGTVRLLREDSDTLEVVPLDYNGYPKSPVGDAKEIVLAKDTVHYWIHRK